MQIENNVVKGLELETGFSTSAEINQMDTSLTFMSTYKWEMGDVNSFYVKKQLLSNQKDANGKRLPYKGNVTEVATQLLIAEGMKPEDITPQLLFDRFNADTDIQALSEFVRGILVAANGKTMTRRVLNPTIKDANGKRIPTTIDKIAGITGAIHQKLRKEQEEKLKLGGVADDVINTTLQAFDTNKKLVKAVKTRVAMEICAIPVDASTFAVKEGFTGLKGLIYSTSTDTYNKLKAKLHTPDDMHLDFLEIKISHPVITKNASKDVNKMQSGMNTAFETFDTAKSPCRLLADFDAMYREYCATSAQSADDLRAKVMDYREMPDEEALSLCKDYVIKNYDALDDEEKEKYNEIVQRFQEVLTAEEIAQISNITFSDSPNVDKADGMNGVQDASKPEDSKPSEEAFFDGMDDMGEGFNLEG